MISLMMSIAGVPKAAPAAPTEGLKSGSYSWHEGAGALGHALEEARAEGRAVAVYFYTDGCGYCRQLETMLLERSKVEGFLEPLTRIRIDPANGAGERLLAQRYGVKSFPAFFVHPAADRAPTRVERAVEVGCTWRLKSQDEFIESIQRALGATAPGQHLP